MKSIVIYHSLTGNTKKIAEKIYDGMSQVGESCDIKQLKEVSPQELSGYDLIGLGSPVMYFRELNNVTTFISSMRGVEGKHGFAFCTHGAAPSNYLARVVPAMKQRGMIVIGWNDWFGSAFFPCIPKPYFTDGHPDDIDLKEAEDFGREMVKLSLGIAAGNTELIPVFPTGRDYDAVYNPLVSQRQAEGTSPERRPSPEDMRERSRKFTNTLSLQFTVDTEKCHYPKCSICMDNCPMNAIDFSISPPIFNRDCEKCFQCEMTCPQGAIEYDYEPLWSMHDAKSGALGMLMKSLEAFEAIGKFRRLVPMEEIGWDMPFYKFKKPRYKIIR